LARHSANSLVVINSFSLAARTQSGRTQSKWQVWMLVIRSILCRCPMRSPVGPRGAFALRSRGC
jgi:hypothetical protein